MTGEPFIAAGDGHDDPDLLAAEYALGVLEGDERTRADGMLRTDESFRFAVSHWRRSLAPLFEEVDPQVASVDLWDRIERAVGFAGEEGAGKPAERMARLVSAWRSGALAASAIAAVLALILVLGPRTVQAPAPVTVSAPVPAPVGPESFAQLVSSSGDPVLIARVDTRGGLLRVRAVGVPDDRKVPELWVIAPGGKPVSLGLIARSGPSAIALSAATRAIVRDGATLAVTLEDAATAPHPAPTNAILAAGAITTI